MGYFLAEIKQVKQIRISRLKMCSAIVLLKMKEMGNI